jgi:hypothetical protein
MDLTYATMDLKNEFNLCYHSPPDGAMFKLNRELERRYHVEDPNNPRNELKYKEHGLGNYAILYNSLGPV